METQRQNNLLTATLIAALCVGCGPLEDLASTPCAKDLDCAPGEICGADALCATASEGDLRTFGEATLTVTSEDDAFLVSMVSLPMDSQAPTGDPLINVTLRGAGEGVAQKLSPTTGHAAQRQGADHHRHWSNRLAFDQARHRGVQRLIDGALAGRRTIDAPLFKNDPCGECDALSMCWEGQCTTEISARFATGAPFTGTLVEVQESPGVAFNVIVESSLTSQSTVVEAAKAAATVFQTTLEDQLTLLGSSSHGGDLDRDNDGRLNLVFTQSSVAEGVVGFFDYRDFLPASDPHASGNESDLLWVQAPGVDGTSTDAAIGTLIHEYTHLSSFARRVYAQSANPAREDLWLDESLAHTVEDLMGWGVTNIRAVEQALEEWDSTGFAARTDSVAMRGMGYTLLRYLIDVDARARGADSATSSATLAAATQIVTRLIEEPRQGFNHSLFQSQEPATYGDWLLALQTTGAEDNPHPERHYLPVGAASSGHPMGFNPRGTFQDEAQNDVTLDSFDPEDLDGIPDEEEGELYVSGSLLFLLTGLDPGQHVIEGVGDALVSGEATDLHLFVERLR
jgi:hypothetical protein